MSLIDWRQFDKELRLKFAEEPETVTAKHVATAIQVCDSINNSGQQWAMLDIVPTKYGQVVNMQVGWIHSNGFRECAQQTWSYTLDKDGNVHVYKHTHP
jgi:hypothetical protein